MNIRQTDFTGFTFDGIHTSELNIYRVSDGDRYDEELIPEINDRTTEIPDNNGEYFWGSNYGKRSFTIKIAYDEVTEVQFRKIRRLFSTRKVVPIVFDERPYKVYYVKMESPIELNYICFDEPYFDWVNHQALVTKGEGESKPVYWVDRAHTELTFDVTQYPYKDEQGIQYTAKGITSGAWIDGSVNHKVYQERVRRIYKGEGTIELVAYYPYAHQLYKVLDAYYEESSEIDQWHRDGIVTRWANVDEWALSSGLLDNATIQRLSIDQPKEIENNFETVASQYNVKIPVYNPGDENTGFYLYIPYGDSGITPNEGEYIVINGDTGTLILEPFDLPENTHETGIVINTVNHLIEGVRWDDTAQHDYVAPRWITTGNVYNDHIKKGDFPKILKTDWRLFDVDENNTDAKSWLKQAIWINCKQGADIKIHYNYLYY